VRVIPGACEGDGEGGVGLGCRTWFAAPGVHALAGGVCSTLSHLDRSFQGFMLGRRLWLDTL
jgi:hypothetical protein